MSHRPHSTRFDLTLPHRLSCLALVLLCCLAGVAPALAGSASETYTGKHAQVALHAEYPEVVPGKPFQLALRIQAEPGWHTYWKNPGDTGLPTRIEWTLPAGLRAGEIEWPTPERIEYQGMINLGYHGDTWLLTTLVASPSQDFGDAVHIEAAASWLICREVCIPDKARLEISLPLADARSTADPRFAEARGRLPALLGEP